jgi:hypothetical protein
VSTFTPTGGSAEITGSVTTTVTGAANPTVANVAMASAGTEYSYALPASTKKFYIKLRDASATMQLAFSAGTSGTTYVTVHRGNWFGEEGLTTSVTLYFQSDVAAQTAEIVSWV